MSSFTVSVKHRGTKYDVEISDDCTSNDFKLQLFSLTSVEPDRQKVIIKGSTLKNDLPMATLGLKPGQTIMMMGTPGDDPSGALVRPKEAPKFAEDMGIDDITALGIPRGIYNSGNTCYLNSAMQMLRSMPEIVTGLPRLPKSGGDMASQRMYKEALKLLDALKSGKETLNANNFIETLRNAYPQFAEISKRGHGYAQQDAEEAFSQVLTVLKMNDATTESGGRSMIDKYMTGTFQTSTRCEEEGDNSTPVVGSEEFSKLSCHITSSINHLQDALRASFTAQIEKRSEVLGRDAMYTKTMLISRLPRYMTVHFVRFFWKRDTQKKAKIMRKVTFPAEIDLTEHCIPELKAKLVPVRDKVREIRKDELDIDRARKRRKTTAVAEPEVSRREPPATSASNATAGDGDTEMVETFKTDAQVDAEKDAALQKAKDELKAILDPELRADDGANQTGLYELSAIITHQGASADSGHYTAYVKKEPVLDPKTGKMASDGNWWWFNDDKVSEVPAEKIEGLAGGELLWTGYSNGRVTSFFGSELRRYSSYLIHPSIEGPVRQLLINDKGVLSLGAKTLHFAQRGGLPIWNLRHDTMKDLQCMSYTSRGTFEVLLAGLQNTMLVVDTVRGEVVRQVPTEYQYRIMKRSKYIYAATDTGNVHILDPTTFAIIKIWNAHSALICDMDAQHDFIVTCGFSYRASQNWMRDPFLNVFDVKKMTSTPPIPFPAGAAFVRMHPRMSTTSIVVSQKGQIHVVDLVNPNASTVRQAKTLTFLNMVDIAPSGEAVALADGEGHLHLWGSPSKIQFAAGTAPEFPIHEDPTPEIDWNGETPLSKIGMPYYREALLSAWPPIIAELAAPPAKLDPQLLASLNKAEWGLYGPNVRRLTRNLVENTRDSDKILNPGIQTPKFLSEKARVSGNQTMPANALEIAKHSGMTADSQSDIPARYKNVEIKYSKFGVDDFDFGFYNETQYSGLEIHIANSYANSLLQLLNYIPLVRNVALKHTATSCIDESCLLCELGFLFDMLHKAEGTICQATNLLKALSKNPKAAQLGLLEEDPHSNNLSHLLQMLARFLLEKITADYGMSASPNIMTTIFNTEASSLIRCSQCKTEYSRPGQAMATDLLYPDMRFWCTPGFLPEEIGIVVDRGQVYCFEGADLKMFQQQGRHNIIIYSLIGMTLNIEGGHGNKAHLVSMIDVSHCNSQATGERQWHLFNDFLVQPVLTEEAINFASWKMPSVIAFQVKKANNTIDHTWKQQLDTRLLYKGFSPREGVEIVHGLDIETEKPSENTIIALDTEFVSVKQPEIEMTSDGERETIRPIVYALARVSVVRGSGDKEGLPFIDDYIAIREPIVDYLTSYSGIRHGDLDPRTSRYDLVSLRVAYKRLWLLLNLGCKFLGHGLKQDFRVINIKIPRVQVIDTINLFFLQSRLRKLSLAFLAWFLLKEDIQMETHDSIEDARTALKLYKKYLEFEDAGILDAMLQDIYTKGREFNFKPPRPNGDPKRSITPPTAAAPGTDSALANQPVTPTPTQTGTGSALGAVWNGYRGGNWTAGSSPLR
ncbi:PAB-dependent poly(A)-specific ribonuclease subunit PAN2 [Ceratocystis platani]|uniref:PAN2-PAN3 deadenylation complex catalytic subunit PAN2 n=1 Tax=Ceratocystis fimbriata f. sp. platani TaxID=88771 RepID=A0A0F8D2H7_CERFI|nr:PAB-dependent poly(A)-specific ribonuclease subunit PAN2 [Ceratocystis platani]